MRGPKGNGGRYCARRAALAWVLGGMLGLGAYAAPCPPGVNLADRDLDGLFDYACAGDWNANGTCEMEQDLQAAVDSLDDPGPKLVEVGDCSFAAPTAAQGQYGILELPNDLTLVGQGDLTVLNGFSGSDVTSTQAVVTNRDRLGGAANIVLRHLAIHGGWDSDDSIQAETHSRMGVFFDACTDCTVEDVTVTDTLHSCLYSRDGTRVTFANSRLRRCGNYTGLGDTFSCVYLYAQPGKTERDTLVTGIDCDGSGWSALNTRRADATAVLSNIVFRDNTVRNTRVVDGVPKLCILFRGVSGMSLLNNVCERTGGVSSYSSTDYYSSGTATDASSDVLVDGLEVRDTVNRPAVTLLGHLERFTGRNILVENATTDCLSIQNPQRDLLLEDVQLSFCGQRGINEFGTLGSGAWPDEGWSLRRIQVLAPGHGGGSWDGIHLRGPARHLALEDVEVVGGRIGIDFEGGLEDSVLRRTSVSQTTGGGITTLGTVRNVFVDAPSIRGAGLTFTQNLGAIEGLRIEGASLVGGGAHAISVHAANGSLGDIEIRDCSFEDYAGDGISIIASEDLPSSTLVVERNTLSNVGTSTGATPYHGIRVIGRFAEPSIADNVLVRGAGEERPGGYGVYHDIPAVDPTYLCSNHFLGMWSPSAKTYVVEDPSYSSDLDGDSQLDPCDNCPDRFNPGQTDIGADGIGDACDLDDELIWVWFADRVTLRWQVEAGWDRWNVYRGDLAQLRQTGIYTQLARRECLLRAPPFVDSTLPSVGQVAFYLVTGNTGGVEGDLGPGVGGALRENTYACSATP